MSTQENSTAEVSKEQLVENLKAYALGKLQILQNYDVAKAEYTAAAGAYQKLTGIDLPGMEKRMGRPTYRPQVNEEEAADLNTAAAPALKEDAPFPQRLLEFLVASSRAITRKEIRSAFPKKDPASVNQAVARHLKLGRVKESSTREISITAAGRTYLKQCQEMGLRFRMGRASKEAPPKAEITRILSSEDVLSQLAAAGKPIRPSDLASANNVPAGKERNNYAIRLSYLKEKGLVKSTTNGTGHGVVYELTRAGLDQVAASLQ